MKAGQWSERSSARARWAPCSREAHDNGGLEKRQQTVTGPLQEYAPNGFYVVDLMEIEGLLGISDTKAAHSVRVTEFAAFYVWKRTLPDRGRRKAARHS